MGIYLIISMFQSEGAALVNMLQLENSDLQFFREVLNVPDEDPLLYGEYQINAEANEKLFQRYGFRFDLERYDCFAGYKSV